MISLVLVVCLSSSPVICRTEPQPFEGSSRMACMILGERLAADWIEEHPDWQVRRWHCMAGRLRNS